MSVTPGPWMLDSGRDRDGAKGISAEGYRVASVCCRAGVGFQTDEAQQEANARLIAAAPDMLDVLHRCAELLDDYSDVVDGDDCPHPNRAMSLLSDVEAAIAKAEGAK